MLRRRSAIALLAAAGALAAAAVPAQATSLHRAEWNVYLSGKQTVTWSFAAESPEECTSYYGTPSAQAKGSGTIGLTFWTPKKKPLWAETYLNGHKLRFVSFNTDGWRIPLTWAKRGSFSVAYGKPCGSRDDDPEPLPAIADDRGCGTRNVKLNVSLGWAQGDLSLLGSVHPYPSLVACPGVFEQEMQAEADTPCMPEDEADGTEGYRLQGVPIPASVSEFTAGRKFTAEVKHKYVCAYPTRWPGEPPLKVTLAAHYEATFKPRR